MMMNQINETTYNVRQTTGTNRYRITLPKQLLADYGIEESVEMGFRAEFAEDGGLTLVYTTNVDEAQKKLTLSLSNTGVVSIPSVFATAVEIGGTPLVWEAKETLSGHVEFRGQTSIELSELVTDRGKLIAHAPLDWREQTDVKHDGKTWSQEQFRHYMTKSAREELGWDLNQSVRVGVSHKAGRPAIVFEPVTEDQRVPDNLVKTAGVSSQTQMDAMLYVPNDIVRSLGLVEQPLMWLDDGGRLLAVLAD